MGKTLHPTPYTRSDLGVSFCRTQKLTAEAHTLPPRKTFSANPKYGKATVAVPPHNTSQNCSNCAQKVPKSRDVRLKTTESGFQRILYLC
jgi:hypothetical protein